MSTQATKTKRVESAVGWAAQADLVLLTVGMLRPLKIPAVDGPHAWSLPAWTTYPPEELRALLEAAGWSARSAKGKKLQAALLEVWTVAQTTPPQSWSDEYWRLFDSSLACPINEASYVRRDKGAILGDIAGFYAAFGWRPDPQGGERPDHLRCELEFMAALLAMAAGAPNREQASTVHQALSEFARLHLHDWLPSFAWQLCEASRQAYFGAVANWLVLFWNDLAAMHRWPVEARPAEPLEPLAETENPYECAAQGLVQLGEH